MSRHDSHIHIYIEGERGREWGGGGMGGWGRERDCPVFALLVLVRKKDSSTVETLIFGFGYMMVRGWFRSTTENNNVHGTF